MLFLNAFLARCRRRYHLSVLSIYPESVIDVIKSHVPAASLENSPVKNELRLRLPMEAADMFPALFVDIEAKRTQLGIEFFSVTAPNFEEVFIRVAEPGHSFPNSPRPSLGSLLRSIEQPRSRDSPFRSQFKAQLWLTFNRIQRHRAQALVWALIFGVLLLLLHFFVAPPVAVTQGSATVFTSDLLLTPGAAHPSLPYLVNSTDTQWAESVSSVMRRSFAAAGSNGSVVVPVVIMAPATWERVEQMLSTSTFAAGAFVFGLDLPRSLQSNPAEFNLTILVSLTFLWPCQRPGLNPCYFL